MPTYIGLINYAQRSMEEIKDSPNRLQAAKEAVSATGRGALYLTMGRSDAIAIGEAPNDEVFAGTILALGAGRKVRLKVCEPSPKMSLGVSWLAYPDHHVEGTIPWKLKPPDSFLATLRGASSHPRHGQDPLGGRHG